MTFLCPQHHSQLQRMPKHALIGCWLRWMMAAEPHYLARGWDRVLPLVGSAYDLTPMICQQSRGDLFSQRIAFVSAVLLSNVLHHSGREEEADRVLMSANTQLAGSQLAAVEPDGEISKILSDEPRQRQLVAQYLNIELHQRRYPERRVH
ncbi:hypothetical protein [Neptunomonas marina]|uniref:Uncharacterized protein n=1 Tax=Neptunomonas marina TaxID=1815562 RepID=A0A437Q4Y9_9GAMM|nr:hypothetical protein [Neptunomonas marina]RVU29568.1 hypothetical protein EOE65_15465 [Neptunomonas marina]